MFLLGLPTIIVGFVVPLFITFYALKLGDVNQIRSWLTYWLVVAIGLQIESLCAPIIALVPLYGALRIVAFVWLMHPQTRGALTLYETYLEPFLASKSDAFDTLVQRITLSDESIFSGPSSADERPDPAVMEESYYGWAIALPKRGQEYLRSWGFDYARLVQRPAVDTAKENKKDDKKADSKDDKQHAGSKHAERRSASSGSTRSVRQADDDYDIVDL